MAERGRSNRAMLARMSRILLLLRGHPAGLTTEDLLDRVGYGDGPRASRMRALHRDLAALAVQGWRIDTLETANTPAVRVLRTVDNRFATLFTPGERAELARAAASAGADWPTPSSTTWVARRRRRSPSVRRSSTVAGGWPSARRPRRTAAR